MKRVLEVLAGALGTFALLAILGGATCIKASVTGPASADGGFVDCSEAAFHDNVLSIAGAVATDLATADYAAALVSLVSTYGVAEVNCAVAYVISRAQLQVTATADSTAATQVSNGKAWLAAHPMQLSGVQ